jgi:transposase
MNDGLHETIRREVEAYSPRQVEIEPEWIANPDNHCTGVKEIANHLGTRPGRSVSERTVNRWVRRYGLPCRKPGGWVIARKDELEAWIGGKAIQEKFGAEG